MSILEQILNIIGVELTPGCEDISFIVGSLFLAIIVMEFYKLLHLLFSRF
jgi:hypothetical protein